MTENDKRTILVTGATGTVGSEVVKRLVSSPSSSSGYNIIRAAVHSQNKADRFRQDNEAVEIVNMDYNKPETIADALNHVNKLFLLTLPSPNMADNASSLVKEAKKKNDLKHIVKLSVLEADAEPGTTIGRLHRQEEKIIEESGIPYTFLCSGAFMQNFVNFFGQTIKHQNVFYIPAGEGKVSFVDVRDIAAVATEILLTKSNGSQQHKNKAYDITGPNALSYSQAAEILSKVIGKKISYIDIPEEDARKGMKKMSMEDWLIDAIIEFYYIIREGHASLTTNVVEQITGRKPISLEQFVRDYASSFS
jgi:uncharacterized protein YbjT (DUF2867 family)